MGYLGLCKEITSMETPPQRLAMLHAEVEALTHYLASLSPVAWQSPSACDQWQVADRPSAPGATSRSPLFGDGSRAPRRHLPTCGLDADERAHKRADGHR